MSHSQRKTIGKLLCNRQDIRRQVSQQVAVAWNEDRREITRLTTALDQSERSRRYWQQQSSTLQDQLSWQTGRSEQLQQEIDRVRRIMLLYQLLEPVRKALEEQVRDAIPSFFAILSVAGVHTSRNCARWCMRINM